MLHTDAALSSYPHRVSLGLAAALRDHARDILTRWVSLFGSSRLRFQRDLPASSFTTQAANLLDVLAMAAAGGPGELAPGTGATRELERACAFLGAHFSGSSASGFDVAAFLLALRDAVAEHASAQERTALESLFEWLTVVALDAFGAAGLQTLRERTIEQLESGTPVVELLPKVPAVLFVGGPTVSVMDSLLSRGLLLCISTGSACLLLDISGLAEASLQQFPKTFTTFITRDAPPSIELVLVGATRGVAAACDQAMQALGRRLQLCERLDLAIEHALRRGGYAVVHTG